VDDGEASTGSGAADAGGAGVSSSIVLSPSIGTNLDCEVTEASLRLASLLRGGIVNRGEENKLRYRTTSCDPRAMANASSLKEVVAPNLVSRYGRRLSRRVAEYLANWAYKLFVLVGGLQKGSRLQVGLRKTIARRDSGRVNYFGPVGTAGKDHPDQD
jgi:hypothetical protein